MVLQVKSALVESTCLNLECSGPISSVDKSLPINFILCKDISTVFACVTVDMQIGVNQGVFHDGEQAKLNLMVYSSLTSL